MHVEVKLEAVMSPFAQLTSISLFVFWFRRGLLQVGKGFVEIATPRGLWASCQDGFGLATFTRTGSVVQPLLRRRSLQMDQPPGPLDRHVMLIPD